ncbi:MAG: hypothetical protein ABSE08_08310 [Syntrophobacteraceae bacterium]
MRIIRAALPYRKTSMGTLEARSTQPQDQTDQHIRVVENCACAFGEWQSRFCCQGY